MRACMLVRCVSSSLQRSLQRSLPAARVTALRSSLRCMSSDSISPAPVAADSLPSPPAGAVPAPAAADATPAVLAHLRRATGPAHDRVEARLFPSGVQDRVLYHRLLQVLSLLHTPWEARFQHFKADFAALDIDVDVRRKAHMLKADIEALPVDNNTVIVPAALAQAQQQLIAAATFPACVGAFYVLEGSTLGGRFLMPQVQKHLGANAPVSFYAGYGAKTGSMWKAARGAIVSAASQSSEAEQQLIAAAVATFEQLDHLADAADWPHVQPGTQAAKTH